MKLKHYCTSMGVTPGKVLFFVGGMDMEEIRAVSGEKGMWNGEDVGTFSEPDSKWGCCWDLGCHQVIWLSSFKVTDPEDTGMLAHEVSHAVFNRARYLGFKLSDDSAEHYCYEAEYLVGCFINAIKEKLFDNA